MGDLQRSLQHGAFDHSVILTETAKPAVDSRLQLS